MEDPSRISLAPRTMVSLWLGAVLPLAAGLATGGVAVVFGGAFAAACPLLVVSSARWPMRARRVFPLYFVLLFAVAISTFEFNSLPFLVDTWSALLLGLLTMPSGRPEEIDGGAVTSAPITRWRTTTFPVSGPRLVRAESRTGN